MPQRQQHQPAVEERLDQIEQLLVRNEKLLADVLRLLARERRPALGDAPELLSVAQAAKVLGRSRTRVIAPAIRRGEIRTVMVGRRQMIPKSEIVRVAEEGIREGAAATPARLPRTRPPARGVGERIRSLPLPAISRGA